MHLIMNRFSRNLNLGWINSLIRNSSNSSNIRPIKKLLVANRGEIAVRIFRTCTELDIRTVAIYSEQDSGQIFRTKADEAYVIGKGLGAVQSYMSIPNIIRIAKTTGSDAIHPGYGFLSEQPDFARACEDANIIFVGPRPETVALMGNKVNARKAAKDAGLNLIPGSQGPIKTVEEAKDFIMKYGLPCIFKASFGGGGRGMRKVMSLDELEETFERAQSEAVSAFGIGELFIERYIDSAKHIEVQIMGDLYGNILHFHERDCSIQRRHQKLVEIAPAPFLETQLREKLLEDSIKLAKHVNYNNAGTVEFLVDSKGQHYFIEVNSRLQVEHTVSEEITGVDLVETQIKVAEGHSLESLGIGEQSSIKPNGISIQCRVTTEDPSNEFTPDFGRLDAYRAALGKGVRLDSAPPHTNSSILPYYDSLLSKVIVHSKDFESACRKMSRTLSETRVRGVKTNIPFLLNVMGDESFISGNYDTKFIDNSPDLLKVTFGRNRLQSLLKYLSNTVVNGPFVSWGTQLPPSRILVDIPEVKNPNADLAKTGWRHIFVNQGPEAFAKAIVANKGVLMTDTTFRDAHQSLLATRVRTHDMLAISDFIANNMYDFLSMEMWGGATFDVSMRFLYECPWERLKELRQRIPNIPFQMLFRGTNAVGYTAYPDIVITKFCEVAKNNGIDIFRIFDSQNYLPNLKVGVEAVGNAGGIIETCICYTGDVSDKSREKYNIAYYLEMADKIMDIGCHILAIKDMAGLLKPRSAAMLVDAIKQRYPDVPLHVHTHDTAGTGIASMFEATRAGADIIDVAVDSMSGITSQPSMGAFAAILKDTPWECEINSQNISLYSAYWEQTRQLYGPFESSVTMKSGNADVYLNEIPGGQYTNLQFQAHSLGMGSQFEAVKKAYRQANLLLGDIIKVTPSSKTVGDLAQFMVQNKLSAEDVEARVENLSLPQSVTEFFQGFIGVPYYGFPEPLRTKILKGRERVTGERLDLEPVDFDQIKKELSEKFNYNATIEDALSYSLYPKVFTDFIAFIQIYGPVKKLPTDVFLAGPQIGRQFKVELETGKTIYFKYVGIIERTQQEKEVFFEVNGETRSLIITANEKNLSDSSQKSIKASKDNLGHVGAPIPAQIVALKVKVGDRVKKNDTLVVLSAMKMEIAVDCMASGVVKQILVNVGSKVSPDDLLIEIELDD